MQQFRATPRLRTRPLPRMAAALGALAVSICAGGPSASAAVLRVGSFNGSSGEFTSIQAAVDQAKPGDFVLVGPGDYHEAGKPIPGGMGDDRAPAAVLVATPGVHVRGMDRNGVMLDGTKPGAPRCSSRSADQNLGPADGSAKPAGRNGIVVYKADGSSVENLSACNFLTGAMGGGDQIWFDGGGASGQQGLGSWQGAYLSATSTFYQDNSSPQANYGIYASNTHGPGLFTQVYANNQGDAAFYIGACPDCNTILDHAHGENSDLGYSGTNSGGRLIIQNSEFNNNQSGFVTNSQNNDDYPSPQEGSCPSGVTGPQPPGTQRAGSCWVLQNSSLHDNNNPNVPTSGAAAAAPVGTGVVIAGGRHDIVTHNRIYNNKAWGVLVVPYPDTELPPAEASPACVGGTPPNQPNPPAGQGNSSGQDPCYFEDFANEVAGNTFLNNGTYHNQGNTDVGEISNPNPDGNCFHDNVGPGDAQPSSDPPSIQQSHGTCGRPSSGDPTLLGQAACDAQIFGQCQLPDQLAHYDRQTKVALIGLPAQPSMPDPCLNVPRNPWCPNNPLNPPPYLVGGRSGLGGRGLCGSRRHLVLHLRRSVSRRLHHATVTVAGKRLHVSRRLTVRLNLRNLRNSTFVVHIRGRLRGGRLIRATRRYHPCTKRRRGARRRTRH